MYAVMKTGGKQYRVSPGDVLRLEKLAADEGETVQFNDVLMVGGDSPTVGTPFVDGAAVQAEVLGQIKGEKVINFVRRRRKHSSKRTKGHRQHLTVVRVTEIVKSGGLSTGVKVALGAAAVAATGAAIAAAAAPGRTRKAAGRVETRAEEAVGAVRAAVGDGERPANLLDAAPQGGADDLKRISGVGPKLEEKLNDVGVYTFAQIAAWSPEEVAYMDDRLSFKGRIERDGWIDQAKQYDAEKE
ncbi:LSU ribosomal protein L21P [Hasllibacter halocynthiae]|uniref:Large ribosomal subunit protein bL21 n=1 Tax=Hasllibacter halocynthiae TaxID=595589 RepID=A0A2T0X8D3_9RHOB|nr:50S ribosomal protein L21 [Hasllibacter halocynthiae]PRY95212.1 LSU ribosomal protein L21P [Hasllibacter halocynthiae]